MDKETRTHKRVEVARFMIRTKYSLVLNETINIYINDHIYCIKLVEDMHGPKRFFVPVDRDEEESSNKDKSLEEVDTKEDEDGENDGKDVGAQTSDDGMEEVESGSKEYNPKEFQGDL